MSARLSPAELEAIERITSHVWTIREKRYERVTVCARCGCSYHAARYFGWGCRNEETR